MKKVMLLAAFAAFSAFAAVDPSDCNVMLVNTPAVQQAVLQSGDVVLIGDQEFVLLYKTDYERLNANLNYVTSTIRAAHSNEQGRVALHGRRGHTTITNGLITVEYADGYHHTEQAKDSATKRWFYAKPASNAVDKVNQEVKERRKSEFRRRREELKKRREEAAGKVTEVTVTKEVR